VLNHRLGKCANNKIGTAINAVQISRFSCQITALNAAVRLPRKACTLSKNLMYDFCLEMRAKGTATCCTASLEKCARKLQLFCSSISVLTCCTTSLEFEPKLLYDLSRKSCPENLPFTVLTQLYGLAEMLPWNVCQAAASFSSLPRNLPCSLALLLSICS